MATFETTRPAPFGAVTTFRMTSALDNMRLSLVEWNQKRSTRTALSKLSDRELSDIGMSRGDIERI